MSSIGCSFCRHANPASAKFCNECGAVLRLQPCPHCDAVNDRDALRCHHCDAALSEAMAPEAAGVDRNAEKPAIETESSVARALETIEADLGRLSGRRAAAGHDTLGAVRLHPFWRAPSVSLRRGALLATLLVVASSAAVIGYQRTLSRPAVESLASQRVETRDAQPVPASAVPEDPKPTAALVAPDRVPDIEAEAMGTEAVVAREPGAAGEDANVASSSSVGAPAANAVAAEVSPAADVSRAMDASPTADVSRARDVSSAVTGGPVVATSDAIRAASPRSAPRSGKTRPRKSRGGGDYAAMRTPEPAPLPARSADAAPSRIRDSDCTASVAALGLCIAPDGSNGR